MDKTIAIAALKFTTAAACVVDLDYLIAALHHSRRKTNHGIGHIRSNLMIG